MSDARWYYTHGNRRGGPVAWEELLALHRLQKVGRTDYVLRDGEEIWITLAAALERMTPREAEPPHLVAARPDPVPAPRQLEQARARVVATIEARPRGAAPPKPAPVPNPVIVEPAEEWSADAIAPWRRYFARLVDATLYGGLALAFLRAGRGPGWREDSLAIALSALGDLVNLILAAIVAALIGGVVIGATGQSLGKAIFGLRVVNAERRAIGVGPAIGREMRILGYGVAFFIPFLAPIQALFAYRRLKRTGTTLWDRNRCTVLYRAAGARQTLLNIAGVLLLIWLWSNARYI